MKKDIFPVYTQLMGLISTGEITENQAMKTLLGSTNKGILQKRLNTKSQYGALKGKWTQLALLSAMAHMKYLGVLKSRLVATSSFSYSVLEKGKPVEPGMDMHVTTSAVRRRIPVLPKAPVLPRYIDEDVLKVESQKSPYFQSQASHTVLDITTPPRLKKKLDTTTHAQDQLEEAWAQPRMNAKATKAVSWVEMGGLLYLRCYIYPYYIESLILRCCFTLNILYL